MAGLSSLLLNFLTRFNNFYLYAKNHFGVVFIIVLIILIFKFKKNYSKSNTFLQYKTGMIVLDGLFQAGKTRFMTMLAKQAEKNKTFVLSNFWNGYNSIQWSSLDDFLLLLKDLLLLGEYQNFTDSEIKIMYGNNKSVLEEKQNIRKELKRKYKNIPYNGYNCNFLILCDEWQNYFYNRGAMSNFTGDRGDFLTLLHQVRHFNSLLIFGTQNSSELDVKFRKLSSLYVNTFDKANDLIYGYNVYSFTTDREFNLDIDKAKKYTKVPVFKFNYYALNQIINRINKNNNRLNNILDKINFLNSLNHLKYNKAINIPEITFKLDELKFFTKFNVNPKIDMYKEGDLFKYLNKFFRNDKNLFKFIDKN